MLNDLKFFGKKKILINSNNLGDKILSLPISEDHTNKQIIYICNKIKEFTRIQI
jgi:dTDP-4-amino-4,6-dideoxygalactose transaminase